MDPRIVKVATELKQYFLDLFLTSQDVSIFLCGGSSSEQKDFRRGLGAAISRTKSKYRYSVFYPEDMFVELILGHQGQDLLTLENLLAKSVSAVVMLLHGPGTFAELGAFSNHAQLKDKLLVVIEPRYQKSPSFINTGPVRYLQKQTKSRVVYHSMQPSELETLNKVVVLAAREIGMASPPTVDLTNPIACYEFYLALIYTLDPVPRSAVVSLAKTLQPDAPQLAQTAAETVLNALVNQRDAVFVSQTLSVSEKGIEALFAGSRTAIRKAALETMLSRLRIEALNLMLRKGRSEIWGEAA